MARPTSWLPLAAAALLAAVAPTAEATMLRLRGVFPQGGNVHASTHSAFVVHGIDLAVVGEISLMVSILVLIGVAAMLLLVYSAWSAIDQWRHWARFRAVERKIQRASEAFNRPQDELLVCPCCVEACSSKPSPSQVTFLCGHRFHTDCCNAWSKAARSTAAIGHCPICENGPRCSGKQGEASERTAIPAQPPIDDCNDEAQYFILSSLHKQFPEIITEECVQRWASCTTHIWQSEMTCPRQKCFMHNKN
mmetsp:Transcript_104267/g.299839  ORF Transcript_104267/g.299839 Transcript_104267/m.299839 type:complete len:250 (-) Transcript_104267:71-820(-)